MLTTFPIIFKEIVAPRRKRRGIFDLQGKDIYMRSLSDSAAAMLRLPGKCRVKAVT